MRTCCDPKCLASSCSTESRTKAAVCAKLRANKANPHLKSPIGARAAHEHIARGCRVSGRERAPEAERNVGAIDAPITPAKLLRLASILGLGPCSVPAGMPALDMGDMQPHAAGLDAEVAAALRDGRLPLRSDPIASVGISAPSDSGRSMLICRDNCRAHGASLRNAHVACCKGSEAIAREAIKELLHARRDAACMRNGCSFDMKVLACHAPQGCKRHFEVAPLGARGKGVDLSASGATALGAMLCIGKAHRSRLSSMSLSSVAQSLGLKSRLAADSMSMPLDAEAGYASMGEHGMRDAKLRRQIACMAGAISEVRTLAAAARCPMSLACRHVAGSMAMRCIARKQLDLGCIADWSAQSYDAGSGFEGGKALTPSAGACRDAICVDFASLRPSIAIAGSMPQDALLRCKALRLPGRSPGIACMRMLACGDRR